MMSSHLQPHSQGFRQFSGKRPLEQGCSHPLLKSVRMDLKESVHSGHGHKHEIMPCNQGTTMIYSKTVILTKNNLT